MPGERTVPNWEEMSDEELARHCSIEMGACLEELVSRYDKRVRDCARRMSIGRDDAEDLVAEIYLRLVASVPHFEGRSAFGTWLYRLAHNTCTDAYRRRARRARLTAGPYHFGQDADVGPDGALDGLPATWGDPVDALEAQIRECYLGQALARLPDDYRRVVLLRLGEGRSTEEVAVLLGTTTDSVKAKLRRARRRLREDLLARRSCPFCEPAGSSRAAGEHGHIG
jgi:RNA polymerase sigma-70 factor (ECF subfamily)